MPSDRRVRDAKPGRTERLPSATGGIARLAYAQALASGIPVAPLLRKAGLTPYQIEDARIHLNVRSQIEFLNLVGEALQDDLLGFHLAQITDLREIGLLFYVLASSEAMDEVFDRACRYSSIMNEGVVQKCIAGEESGVSLSYVGVTRHSDRHQIEFWMTAVLRICRQLTGLRLLPTRVRLVHHREGRHPELAEFFGDNIEFGAPVDELAFEPRVRQLPVVSADSYLNKLLVAYCEEALAHRPRKSGSFRVSLENAIVPLLPHGKARTSEVVKRLGVSQRTLARRLENEGLTFSGVLESLRSDLAVRYLADPALSVSQIAWLLGYQEVGAFSHAFKRWRGVTPRQVRAGVAAGLPAP